jgi:hypothetical protein
MHHVVFYSEVVQFVERIDTCTNKHASEAHKAMALFLVAPLYPLLSAMGCCWPVAIVRENQLW